MNCSCNEKSKSHRRQLSLLVVFIDDYKLKYLLHYRKGLPVVDASTTNEPTGPMFDWIGSYFDLDTSSKWWPLVTPSFYTIVVNTHYHILLTDKKRIEKTEMTIIEFKNVVDKNALMGIMEWKKLDKERKQREDEREQLRYRKEFEAEVARNKESMSTGMRGYAHEGAEGGNWSSSYSSMTKKDDFRSFRDYANDGSAR